MKYAPVDLAEHVAGEPYHYRHGWVPILPTIHLYHSTSAPRVTHAHLKKEIPETKSSKGILKLASAPKGENSIHLEVPRDLVSEDGHGGFTMRHADLLPEHFVVSPRERKIAQGKAKAAKARQKIRDELVTHKVDSKNVVDMWDQTTPDEKIEGTGWYTAAHDQAEAISTKYGLSMEQAAGLVAIYSAQTPWGTNLTRAAIVAKNRQGIGGEGSGVLATDLQRQGANQILAGTDIDEVLTGRKINNFAHLILEGGDVGDEQRVVADRHAIGVARGISMSEDQYNYDNDKGSISGYERYSDAYREAAAKITERDGHPISAHQVQAATWLARQRLNRGKNAGRANTRGVNDWNDWLSYASDEGITIPGGAGVGYELNEFDAEYLDLAYEQAADPSKIEVRQTPPEQSDQLKDIVEVLLAAYAADKTAHLLADIAPGITVEVWKAALRAAGSKVRARPLIKAHELEKPIGKNLARAAAKREVYYRAAYIANAARRIQTDVGNGASIKDALVDEKRVLKTHQAARNNRLNAAGKSAFAAEEFGELLGWYLDPLLNNEAECVAANGHNFYASEGTVIGYPGASHLNCGCTAGPPIAGAGMVNDAIEASRHVIFQTPRRYGLKAS